MRPKLFHQVFLSTLSAPRRGKGWNSWKGGWKGFKAGNSPEVKLFRMSDDPGERVDRAREFPDVLAGLIKR